MDNFEFPHKYFLGEDLRSNSAVNQFKKDEFLAEEIIGSENISIINCGVIVLFWKNENNTKIIIDFKSAGEVLRPAIEISKEKAGKFYAQALTDSKITSVKRDFFCTCSIRNEQVSNLYYGVLTKDISSTYRQLKLLKEADLEKRYEIFLKEYKHVYNQISDRMIASFLGVHYTTLSRVKTRLLDKTKMNYPVASRRGIS